MTHHPSLITHHPSPLETTMRLGKNFLSLPGKLPGALLLALCMLHASAQTYPAKPIRMIVGFAPGGTGEFMSRTITPRMGELLGQQFIIDFRGGGGPAPAPALVAPGPARRGTGVIQKPPPPRPNPTLLAPHPP